MATVMVVPAATEQSKAIVVPSSDNHQSHHQAPRAGAGAMIGSNPLDADTELCETGSAEANPGATSAEPMTNTTATNTALTILANVNRTIMNSSLVDG